MDSKERFSGCADNYVKYRPSYPPEAIDCLMEVCGLAFGMSSADVGAGTGKLTRLLLERGLAVYAVEPNDAMRTAMEQSCAGMPGFLPVKASAEETGLRGLFEKYQRDGQVAFVYRTEVIVGTV